MLENLKHQAIQEQDVKKEGDGVSKDGASTKIETFAAPPSFYQDDVNNFTRKLNTADVQERRPRKQEFWEGNPEHNKNIK